MPEESGSAGPDTRERILSCAEALFGAKGYDSVAVSDIAEACNISTSLIYYHYRDKESLLRALIERAEEVLSRPAIAALEHGSSAGERIAAFTHAWVETSLSHRPLVRILIRPFTDPEGPFASEFHTMIQQAIGQLADVIERGVADGEFEQVDPYLSAECLFALVNTRVVARAVNAPHSKHLDASPAQTADFICRLFLQGIGRPC